MNFQAVRCEYIMRYSYGVRLQVTDMKTTSFTCDCHSDDEGGRDPGRPAAHHPHRPHLAPRPGRSPVHHNVHTTVRSSPNAGHISPARPPYRNCLCEEPLAALLLYLPGPGRLGPDQPSGTAATLLTVTVRFGQ